MRINHRYTWWQFGQRHGRTWDSQLEGDEISCASVGIHPMATQDDSPADVPSTVEQLAWLQASFGGSSAATGDSHTSGDSAAGPSGSTPASGEAVQGQRLAVVSQHFGGDGGRPAGQPAWHWTRASLRPRIAQPLYLFSRRRGNPTSAHGDAPCAAALQPGSGARCQPGPSGCRRRGHQHCQDSSAAAAAYPTGAV